MVGGVLGCTDESPLTSAMVRAFERQATRVCQCHSERLGFEHPYRCENGYVEVVMLPSEEALACWRDFEKDGDPQVIAYLECRVAAEQAMVDCLSAAGCNAFEDFLECETETLVAVGECPSLDSDFWRRLAGCADSRSW
jgi:hypothetical protein